MTGGRTEKCGIFWWGSLWKSGHLENLGSDGQVILKHSEKTELEVRINSMCSGQKLMIWAYMQGNEGL